ncbi:Cys-every-fifth radical SAM/SPASM peptide maturase CefB [Paenibacillus donghaensis]|uniref:Radical SAM protein n=1 Tax=Paenibacillus donghaensis TaxID=414771 RepID=A0A2Z2KP77_9BACL|nr:Cys-every-fifth radical SAM/SPASM peptide maturase CefB [Paenibacillus donghaensis]ASA25483.1 radical SAM protein [Paenibacillus donghaensis]
MKLSKFNLLLPNRNNNGHILFNTLSGHSFTIDDSIASEIQCENVQGFDEDTFKLFVDYGIVVNDEIDENRFFTYFHNKQKFSNSSISSTVLLTWACNLNCVYCYEGAGSQKTSMKIENADNYIRFIVNEATSKNVKNISINLFGGEPLINIDVGFYILDNLKRFCLQHDINLTSSIITNGTLLTYEIVEKLQTYNCQMLQITLDGTEAIHDTRRMYKGGRGSFNDIIKVLKMINEKQHSIQTVIRINVDKTNLSETYELLEYIGFNGENLVNCTVDFGIVRGSTAACSAYSGNCIPESDIGDVLEKLWIAAEKQGFKNFVRPSQKWLYCGLYGDNQYTVTPNCDVYKCWEHAGDEKHMIGQINEEGILENIKYAFFDWMSKNPLDNVDCKQCAYLPSCGGGCGVVSYNETGSYHSKGCFKIKGVLEKQILRYVDDTLDPKVHAVT